MHLIELKKVRHVIEIARHGGFAKAAEALHITQSALTKSVQSVEGRLGLRLLERGPRGVRLTPEGERFVRLGGRLIADAEALELDARSVRAMEVGRIRVGAAPAAFDLLFLSALPGFASRWPGIRVETVADDVQPIVRLVLNGELDFAVGAFEGVRDNRDLAIEPLAGVPLQLFVRRGHPLDREEPPTVADIMRFPWVGPHPPEPHMTILRGWATQYDSPFATPQIIVDAFSTIVRVVNESDCVAAVLAARARDPGFAARFRTWPDWRPLPDIAVSIASRTGWEPGHAPSRMIQLMREASGH